MNSSANLREYDIKLTLLARKTRIFFKECVQQLSNENQNKILKMMEDTHAGKATLKLSAREEFIWAAENILLLCFEMSRFPECQEMCFHYFLGQLSDDEQKLVRIFLGIVRVKTFLEISCC